VSESKFVVLRVGAAVSFSTFFAAKESGKIIAERKVKSPRHNKIPSSRDFITTFLSTFGGTKRCLKKFI